MKLVLKLKIFVVIIVLKIAWFLSYYFEKIALIRKYLSNGFKYLNLYSKILRISVESN